MAGVCGAAILGVKKRQYGCGVQGGGGIEFTIFVVRRLPVVSTRLSRSVAGCVPPPASWSAIRIVPPLLSATVMIVQATLSCLSCLSCLSGLSVAPTLSFAIITWRSSVPISALAVLILRAVPSVPHVAPTALADPRLAPPGVTISPGVMKLRLA